MKLEETSAPYSRETLERLMKVLAQYQVLPWLNPVTNAISIKDFNFMHYRPFMQESCLQE